MMTPSIVRAVRSLPVPRRERARWRRSPDAHAAILPVADVDLAVGHGRDVGVVGDQDDGPAGGMEVVEELDDLGAGVAVEVARRLVGEEDGRLRDEGAGDPDALLLAARQLGRLVVQAVAQAQPLEDGLRAGVPLAARRRPGT